METKDPDALIEEMALWVERAGLTEPVVALLEAHKPLAFLGSQAMLFLQPLLSPFLSNTERFIAFLEDQKNMERLLDRLTAGKSRQTKSTPDTPPSAP